jgi:aryl sulfotransferase
MNEHADAGSEADRETDSPGAGDRWIDPEAQGAPWVNPEIQQQIRWRDGDIVISVPVKSGTTWTMNIVHQLRSGGDPDLDDIYLEVPWLEFLGGPSVTPADVLSLADSMPHDRRRAFKTHSAPATLPYQAPGSGTDVKYVVIVRNPDEVLASFYPFIGAHAARWFELWGIDKQEFVPSDMPSFFEAFGKAMLPGGLFGFVAAWWPLRHEPNVLLMHFSDMKRDHEGSVRRIAEFLGFEPAEEQWAGILEYTSFPWMKQHEDKFELRKAGDVPVLDPGAMLRKGKAGAAREDGVTPEMSAELDALGREILNDPQAVDWLYRGGALP